MCINIFHKPLVQLHELFNSNRDNFVIIPVYLFLNSHLCFLYNSFQSQKASFKCTPTL